MIKNKKYNQSTFFCFAVGRASIQSSTSNSLGDWQGKEPMAECRRALGSVVAILRHERDELLHGTVWSVACIGCARSFGLGSRLRTAHREAQVAQHRSPHESCQSLNILFHSSELFDDRLLALFRSVRCLDFNVIQVLTE